MKLGVLIGWVSGVIYLSSRIPQVSLALLTPPPPLLTPRFLALQLRMNYKRRSVEGLSLGMFTMAIMGNLTYGVSLLLRPLSMVYFVSRLPWLVPLPPTVFNCTPKLLLRLRLPCDSRDVCAGGQLVRVLLRHVYPVPVLLVQQEARAARLSLQ